MKCSIAGLDLKACRLWGQTPKSASPRGHRVGTQHLCYGNNKPTRLSWRLNDPLLVKCFQQCLHIVNTLCVR